MKPATLWIATTTMALSAASYLAIAAGFVALVSFLSDEAVASDRVIFFSTAGFCAFLGLLTFLLAIVLHRGKRWAYYVAFGVFCIYLPSLFFPFGAVGLYILLKKENRTYFGALEEL